MKQSNVRFKSFGYNGPDVFREGMQPFRYPGCGLELATPFDTGHLMVVVFRSALIYQSHVPKSVLASYVAGSQSFASQIN